MLSGDRVIAGELKLSPRELRLGDRWGLAPFVFCDAARVENLDSGSETRTLIAVGAVRQSSKVRDIEMTCTSSN